MQELGGQGSGQGFYGFALLRGKIREFRLRTRQFGHAELFGLLLEGFDGGNSVAGLEALVVFVHFSADDSLGCRSFAAAIGQIGSSDLLEIVDVVDEASFDLVHAGIDVARDGDVDEEHGAVATAMEEVLAVGASEDLLGSAGGGDDDVGAIGLFVESLEGNGFGVDGKAAEVLCDLFSAGLSSIGDEDGGCALLNEVACG